MSPSKAIATGLLGSLLLGWLSVRTPTNAEELSILDLGEAVSVPIAEDDGYAEITDSNFSAESAADISFLPRSEGDDVAQPEILGVPYSPSDDCESCGAIIERDGCEVAGRSGWIVELGASALQSQMATSENEDWPNEFGSAGRLALGYEWANGLGIRTQAWGYSVEGEVVERIDLSSSLLYYYSIPYVGNYGDNSYYTDYSDLHYFYVPDTLYQPFTLSVTQRIEISAATAYIDIYKSFNSRYGDLAIGMGPAFGHLEFNVQPAGDGRKYDGGGISVFGQGHLPLFRRGRWELAFTGQSRFSLLTGEWRNQGWGGAEQSRNMSIFELKAGPEFRVKIGRNSDRHLYLSTLAEFQQWRSDGMGPIAGDTLGLQGVSLDFGLLW